MEPNVKPVGSSKRLWLRLTFLALSSVTLLFIFSNSSFAFSFHSSFYSLFLSSFNFLSLFFSSLLCLTLPECPEEKGGAFQRPGDRSPLSGSGPETDREIRIRIAASTPVMSRAGEWGGEVSVGRRRMKGFPLPLASGIPSVFTLLPPVML